ncbi:hypothetical protein VTK56DRAFT_4689 [Thermocarpiscus australiensis]
MSDEIHFPSGFTMKDLVAYGNTGLVLLDRSTDTAVKASPDGERSDAIAVEQQIYERFVQRGGHKGILIYYGTFEWGIRLEHASYGNIRSYLENHAADELRRIRWAVQVAEALDFTHQCGVIHGDVNGFNVLLDRRLDAKLADFAGSSLDGSPLLIGVTASHEYPGPLLCTEADIFALGSTLYELMNESRPYAGLSDVAIAQKYKRGEFAETESLGSVGRIIKRNAGRGSIKNVDKLFAIWKPRGRAHSLPAPTALALPSPLPHTPSLPSPPSLWLSPRPLPSSGYQGLTKRCKCSGLTARDQAGTVVGSSSAAAAFCRTNAPSITFSTRRPLAGPAGWTPPLDREMRALSSDIIR